MNTSKASPSQVHCVDGCQHTSGQGSFPVCKPALAPQCRPTIPCTPAGSDGPSPWETQQVPPSSQTLDTCHRDTYVQ